MNVDQRTRLNLLIKKRFENVDLLMIKQIDLFDKNFDRKFDLC